MVILIHFSCLCHYRSKVIFKKTEWRVVIFKQAHILRYYGRKLFLRLWYLEDHYHTHFPMYIAPLVHITKLIQLISLRANSITCKLLHLTPNFHVHGDTPLYCFTNNREFYLLWQPLLKELIFLTTQIDRSSSN